MESDEAVSGTKGVILIEEGIPWCFGNPLIKNSTQQTVNALRIPILPLEERLQKVKMALAGVDWERVPDAVEKIDTLTREILKINQLTTNVSLLLASLGERPYRIRHRERYKYVFYTLERSLFKDDSHSDLAIATTVRIWFTNVLSKRSPNVHIAPSSFEGDKSASHGAYTISDNGDIRSVVLVAAFGDIGTTTFDTLEHFGAIEPAPVLYEYDLKKSTSVAATLARR